MGVKGHGATSQRSLAEGGEACKKRVRPDNGDLCVAAVVPRRDSQPSHRPTCTFGSKRGFRREFSIDVGFSSAAESCQRCAGAPGRFTQDLQHKIKGIGHCFGFLNHVIILEFNGVEKPHGSSGDVNEAPASEAAGEILFMACCLSISCFILMVLSPLSFPIFSAP